MSTGLNCTFEEVKKGVWYYVLEQDNAPKNAWNWREYADAYGPFASEELARDHLHRNHANPGGSMTNSFAGREGRPLSDVLKTLIKKATR